MPALPTVMPALFIGHGSPMNAIGPNPYAAAWSAVAARLPRPTAILCVSAHWQTSGTQVTTASRPRTIHDFFGFPPALFQMQYPAPGSPELAARVCRLVRGAMVRPVDDAAWGIDHGAWSVLCRIYPDANIPVVQLSLDRSQPPDFHYRLGSELQALRREGVLVLGSGNLVHNLRLLREETAPPYPWAVEFDRLAAELILAGDHQRLVDYPSLGEAARLAVPTDEHYLPLLYILALQQPGERLSFFAEGFPHASLSMRSLQIGE